MCCKEIEHHWEVYGNGNGAYLQHKITSTTVKYYELDHNGKAIKIKSLFAMFGHKTDQKKGISLYFYSMKPNITKQYSTFGTR